MIFQLAALHIIGQTAFRPLFARTDFLAAMRSPSFLPDGLSEMLFESHWLLWIGAAILGTVFMFISRSRNDPRLQRIGAAAVTITALWILAAMLIDTPTERLYAAHSGLAQAAREHDVDKMLTYLSQGIISPAINLRNDTSAKEEITARLNTYGVKTTHITFYQYYRRGSTALSNITFITETNLGLIKTAWRFSWDDVAGENWKIIRAELLRVADQPVPSDFVIQ